jgi:hypothetical protein
VLFQDGTRLDYDPPRNTLDARYVACTKHQVACDCREAEYQEEIAEFRGEFDLVRKALATVLDGHRAIACMCTGCQIARNLGLTHLIKHPEEEEEVPF